MPIETAVHRLKRRRTKIVATLGPASAEPEVLEALIEAGVDVFRLNFSHGSHADHGATYARVRAAAQRAGAPVAILADLCGPKIRTGLFKGGRVELTPGERVTVTVRDVQGERGLIPSQYASLAQDVEAGSRILMDDGNLELAVESVAGTEIQCLVVVGGPLKDKKGINLPGVAVSAPSLTEKDRADAEFALGLGVDFLALSFVRRAEDVDGLREIVRAAGSSAAIIAKIEKPEALSDIERIVDASDGVMVARGDLGVELPPEVVPIVQSQLVDLGRIRGKPVIVATQMLESMTEHARPTRAEVTDVSSAVRSGADAVMLSAETASGAYPVRAVQVMDRVARETEGYLWGRGAFGSMSSAPIAHDPVGDGPATLPIKAGQVEVRDAVARATGQLSRDLWVRAIAVFTRSGWSAAMVSSSRPQAPILAVSDDPASCRRMNLLWGVVPVLHPMDESGERLHAVARQLALDSGLAAKGEHILRVWGFNADQPKNVPTVSVLEV